MPDFWEFPTVSMGLGPIMSIYQARFNRYLEDRGLKKRSDNHVWAFLGDGKTDEDAFRALPQGITIRVGKSKHSYAEYYVSNVGEVRKFLVWLLKLFI